MRARRSEAEAQQPITIVPSVRCAIYTRKSTDEGLAQEFNSLDAQRESCEAYIASQWLQPLQDGKPQGAARLVRDNMGEGIRPLGFTRDGAYYYATSNAGQRVYTASLDLEKGIVTDSPAPAPQILGSNEGPEWSPDGKYLAYIHGGNSIVIHSLDTGEERSLTTMQNIFTVGSGDRYLRWSPDGRQLLVPQNRTLFLVNVATGEASPTVTDGRSRYGRWSPDGKVIFYARLLGLNDAAAQIVRLNLETQQKEVLYTSAVPGDTFASLEPSPDGRWLAFSGYALEKTFGDEETVLMVMPTEGGQPRLLLQVPGAERVKVVGWTPDAREILFTRDLKLATEPSTTLWRIQLEGGEPRKIELGMNVLNDIRFHPDGRRVAFDSGQRSDDPTFGPAWSPDGGRLAYFSTRGASDYGPGARTIVIRSTKTGEERVVSPKLNFPSGHPYELRWSRNGRSLLTIANDDQGLWSFYLVDVQTGDVSLLVRGRPDERIQWPSWSLGVCPRIRFFSTFRVVSR